MAEIKIRFNKGFYSAEVIQKALEDYRELCSGRVDDSENFIEVTIFPNPGVPNSINGEFCNYALGLMKNL